MPHNFYLHTSLVQSRVTVRTPKALKQALLYNVFDTALALNCAFFVNCSILIGRHIHIPIAVSNYIHPIVIFEPHARSFTSFKNFLFICFTVKSSPQSSRHLKGVDTFYQRETQKG